LEYEEDSKERMMSIWDDLLQFSGQLLFLALICSSIFWAIASGSLAINARTKQPLTHLVLGALFHFIWFGVVGILYFVNLAKRKNTKTAEIANVPTQEMAKSGFDEW
jgi:branched-subunit amino acid transport protein